MPSRKEITLRENIITAIGGDRRAAQRYAADLPLRYTVIEHGVVTGAGIGATLDMSSGGMAFRAAGMLRAGAFVEASVEWPVADQDGPLELVMLGRVVRSDGDRTAMRNERHEFRRRQETLWGSLPMAAGFC